MYEIATGSNCWWILTLSYCLMYNSYLTRRDKSFLYDIATGWNCWWILTPSYCLMYNSYVTRRDKSFFYEMDEIVDEF